jgi:hypothetical protein
VLRSGTCGAGHAVLNAGSVEPRCVLVAVGPPEVDRLGRCGRRKYDRSRPENRPDSYVRFRRC